MNQYNTLPKNVFPERGGDDRRIRKWGDRQNTRESRSAVPHVPVVVSEFPYWRCREN